MHHFIAYSINIAARHIQLGYKALCCSVCALTHHWTLAIMVTISHHTPESAPWAWRQIKRNSFLGLDSPTSLYLPILERPDRLFDAKSTWDLRSNKIITQYRLNPLHDICHFIHWVKDCKHSVLRHWCSLSNVHVPSCMTHQAGPDSRGLVAAGR